MIEEKNVKEMNRSNIDRNFWKIIIWLNNFSLFIFHKIVKKYFQDDWTPLAKLNMQVHEVQWQQCCTLHFE